MVSKYIDGIETEQKGMKRILTMWNRYQKYIICSVAVLVSTLILFWGLGDRDFYED